MRQVLWRRAEDLFHAALERSAEERRVFLDEACGEDAELRRQVEVLVSNEEHAGSFLEKPVLADVTDTLVTGESLVGRQFGQYRILSPLGAGGMGKVYRAHDSKLGRDVAIKILPPEFARDPDRLARFRREAHTLASLNHPSIAAIYGLDESAEADYLVLELVEGDTLHGPLPLATALDRARQVAEALETAHEHGIIHRDLKPANLKVTPEGRVKVLDFGLAKAITGTGEKSDLAPATTVTSGATVVGNIVGTPGYMSPEQARGAQVDQRTDIWAFGCLLYELLTGRRAFESENVSDTIAAVLEHEPDWQALPVQTPAKIRDLLRRCLCKDASHRLGNIADARNTIEEVQHRSPRGSAVRLDFFIRHKAVVAATVGALILLLIAFFWLTRTKKPAVVARTTASIAVLPFTDLSPEKNQEYFADGLAEELLNSLAQIPGLHVAARTSAFQFKGKTEDLRVIGQKLNVATVLEGSVRTQGRRVRISTQLIQVSDGFHLWSEAYDRDLTDIFGVQEDIARSVAASLKVTLLGDKAVSPRATNIEAYNAYLQGRYFYARGDSKSIEKAIAYYEQAVNLDPNYAPAWAALSSARSTQAGEFSGGPFYEGYNRAREAAERALALDPSLAEGHAALGAIRHDFDWDWPGADACYQRALALEPGNVEVLHGAAFLAATLNHFEEALWLDRRAVELDPLQASAPMFLATHALWAGRLDDATAAARKGLELNPQYPFLHTVLSSVYLARSRPLEALAEAERDTDPALRLEGLALAYHALGRKQESDRALAELIAKYAGIGAFQIAEVYAFRGEADQAFQWLDRAYSQHDPGLTLLKGDRDFRNLERDPRYTVFLRKMHLLD